MSPGLSVTAEQPELLVKLIINCHLTSELVMGWVHPRVGWVGLGQSFFNFWWVGLGWVET